MSTPENFYQGNKDVFLSKVRADFDAIEEQSTKSLMALSNYSLIGSDPDTMTLFTKVNENDTAVWRHVGTTGVNKQGKRQAGGNYPRAQFIRTWETAVHDPDEQDANSFVVPEEREMKEARAYATALNRAKKVLNKMVRTNLEDPFEVFNLAFSAPADHPTRFFVRGNMGLDGNNTPLNERLVSTQHARADGGATQSNALNASGNARPFSADAFWAAMEQGATIQDDVGESYPVFGGRVTLLVPPANGYVKEANELNASQYEPGTDQNQINVINGLMAKIISTPSLLRSKYVSAVANNTQWFMVDESSRDAEIGTGLVSIDFVPMSTNVYRDQDVDSVVYTAKQEKVYGFGEWRCVLGSNGTGSAYSS